MQATFWLLGSLGGAAWPDVLILVPVVSVCVGLLFATGRGIDAAVLGATAARSMGVDVRRLRWQVVAAAAVATAAATAVAGVIAFVGLVAPLAVRRWAGAQHRRLVVASAGLGGIVVVAADLLARTLFAPTELPVGVIVAAVGAPVFLTALLREQRAGRL